MNAKLINSETYYVLGTTIRLSIYDGGSQNAIDDAIARLYEIDAKMSYFKADSEISGINAVAGKGMFQISDDTAFVLDIAVQYSQLSKGSLDPTIRPVINQWRIFSKDARIPSEKDLKKALSLVNYNDIVFGDGCIGLKRFGQEIDLGCIAKGFAADEIKNIFLEHGVKSALIDLGGNIYAVGNDPNGSAWKIGIQDPFGNRGEILGYLEVSDKSVVTSGVYEKNSIIDGIEYHHIINPHTGYPADNSLASVTLISEHSIDGDALSTIGIVLGLDEGYDFINSTEDVEAVFVTMDKKIHMTSGLLESFRVINPEYTIG